MQKSILYSLTSLIPLPRRNCIFTTSLRKENEDGPGRFLHNLEKGLRGNSYKLERFFLSKCRVALIMSCSPGDIFHNICKRKNIKTVLRIDGFYLPDVFDNRQHQNRSARMMTVGRININQRIQKDILLSDWVVYQSEFSRKMAGKYLYNRTENYSIIYNGVDVSHFIPQHRRNKKIVIMALGNWRDADIVCTCLESFRLFEKKRKSEFKLIGQMANDVEKRVNTWLADHAQLGDSISIVGKVGFEQLPDFINQCDIALHIKCGDWCPNAVLESLACGVPVVYHELGGTKETVGNAGIAIEYEPYCYDEEYARKASDSILKIADELEEYRERARHQALNFSIEKVTQQYMEVLLS